MLNEQLMVSQVFPDMYPHGDAGPQLFADAELDELTKDLAAARAARGKTRCRARQEDSDYRKKDLEEDGEVFLIVTAG